MLSRMARDVLAIPVSTVASESAFSTDKEDALSSIFTSSKIIDENDDEILEVPYDDAFITVRSYLTYLGDDAPTATVGAAQSIAGGRFAGQRPLRISLRKETVTPQREADKGAKDEEDAEEEEDTTPQHQLWKRKKLAKATEKKRPRTSSTEVEPLTVEGMLSELGLGGEDVVIVDEQSDRDSFEELLGALEPLAPGSGCGEAAATERAPATMKESLAAEVETMGSAVELALIPLPTMEELVLAPTAGKTVSPPTAGEMPMRSAVERTTMVLAEQSAN
ncbi:hypothetical protein Taro_044960 [Colocasia esculenta]|uniref:HAT C-terminal dimerisation domain-containing protein n=1 Tax=Colocasia esculenta TaxID=4460 RepID=A0A843X1U6_COLES|nr:hypothetical protein [Colocasia esculenta]